MGWNTRTGGSTAHPAFIGLVMIASGKLLIRMSSYAICTSLRRSPPVLPSHLANPGTGRRSAGNRCAPYGASVPFNVSGEDMELSLRGEEQL